MNTLGQAKEAPELTAWSLSKQTYHMVLGSLGSMARMLWLLIGLNLVLSYYQVTMIAANFEFSEKAQRGEGLGADVATLAGPLLGLQVASLVQLWVMCGVLVALHRFVLLDEKPSLLGFRIGMRELRYGGYFLLIFFITPMLLIVPMMALMSFGPLLVTALASMAPIVMTLAVLLAVVTLVGYSVIMIRLGLVMPAIATDQQGGIKRRIKQAWSMGKGRVWTILGAIFIIGLPWIVISMVTNYVSLQYMPPVLSGGAFPVVPSLVMAAAQTAVGVIVVALLVVLFSLVYKFTEQAVPATTELELENA